MIIYNAVFLHIDQPRPTTTKITFFAPKNDGTVEEIFSQKEQAQWIKVKANKDGYFLLKDPLSGKFLTQGAIGFAIKGNIDASMHILNVIVCN